MSIGFTFEDPLDWLNEAMASLPADPADVTDADMQILSSLRPHLTDIATAYRRDAAHSANDRGTARLPLSGGMARAVAESRSEEAFEQLGRYESAIPTQITNPKEN
jgi:hypothetical protein